MLGGTETGEDGVLPADENGRLAQGTGKVEVVGCDADTTRGCDVGGAVHAAPRESEGAGVSVEDRSSRSRRHIREASPVEPDYPDPRASLWILDGPCGRDPFTVEW